MANVREWLFISSLIVASGCAQSQDFDSVSVFDRNLDLRIHHLPLRTADSDSSLATLAAALESLFQDSKVCCAKDSALQDTVPAVTALSLKELTSR